MGMDKVFDAYYAWRSAQKPEGLSSSSRLLNGTAISAFSQFGTDKKSVRARREARSNELRLFAQNAALTPEAQDAQRDYARRYFGADSIVAAGLNARAGFNRRLMTAAAAGDRVVSSSENEHVEIQGEALSVLKAVEKNTRGGVS